MFEPSIRWRNEGNRGFRAISWQSCHLVKISWDKNRKIAFFLSHWTAPAAKCYEMKKKFVCRLIRFREIWKKKFNTCLLGMYLASSAVCFGNRIENFARSRSLLDTIGLLNLTLCNVYVSIPLRSASHRLFPDKVNICADKPQRFAIQVTNCIHPMDDGRCERVLPKDVRWMHNECERTSESIDSCALQDCIYQ